MAKAIKITPITIDTIYSGLCFLRDTPENVKTNPNMSERIIIENPIISLPFKFYKSIVMSLLQQIMS